MERREFLSAGGRAVLGLSMAPFTRRAVPGQRGGSADDPALIARLEKEIPVLMTAAQVPGVSVALVKDGRVLWRRGFGVRDIRSNVPVDEDTVFEAASTSKPVFAYLVMKLGEKGLLDLDVPLTKYTPERILEGDARLDLITARHVLAHTTGLPNWRSKQNPFAIRFTPGEKWGYSGEGYTYLQSIVARLLGSRVTTTECGRFELGLEACATSPSIDEHMRKHVLVPFGMTASGYLWTPSMAPHVAWGHDPKGQPLPTNRKPSGPSAARYGMAGGLYTTPGDYAKFLMEVVAPKPADDFRLTSASLREMLRPQVKRTDDGSWALGWEVTHTPAGNIIRHGGGNPGFACFVAASVERRSGYVIMTNSEDNGFHGVIVKLIAGDALGGLLGATLKP